jgi:hypothetical protein
MTSTRYLALSARKHLALPARCRHGTVRLLRALLVALPRGRAGWPHRRWPPPRAPSTATFTYDAMEQTCSRADQRHLHGR